MYCGIFTKFCPAAHKFLLHRALRKMQHLLKEEGFRTAGRCARLKPQQSITIVRRIHSDGLAPHNMGVSLISFLFTEI